MSDTPAEDRVGGWPAQDAQQGVHLERERLFSEAAHEFRTPLAIIGCNAELISEGLIQGAEAQEAARVIIETVHETDRKLSQLLENARHRLEPGPPADD